MPLKVEGKQEAVAPESSAALYVEGVAERGTTWRGLEKLTDLVAEDGPRLMIVDLLV